MHLHASQHSRALSTAPCQQTGCPGPLRGPTRRMQPRRSVRAIQLPHKFAEQWPASKEEAAQHAYDAGYWRGYEEGLLAAQQQQLLLQLAQPAPASSRSSSIEAAAPAAPAAPAAKQQAEPCGCKDSVLRSAIKGLSWRFFGLGVTMLLAYTVLGGGKAGGVRWSEMLRFGVTEFFAKYITFFIHERIWAAIPLLR